MSDLSLTVNKRINGPIAQVFDAWLDAEMLAKFMLPGEGMPNPEVTADGRQGGRFTILMQGKENQIPHHGEYLEVDRPNKLVFSWNSPFSADGSKVTLSFAEAGDNQTDVVLHHEIFPDETSRDNHQAGWGRILQVLDEVVSAVTA